MIVLSLVFCLSAQPTICQQVTPDSYPSGIACFLDAQQKAAEWESDHPKWRLTRWRCGPPERET